jgi:histidine triad (HIT) family protein
MSSIFTKIINGEVPAYKVAETDQFLAFLDIFPLIKGHTLVVPKKEVDYIFDLDDETLSGLHLFSKRVALAIGRTMPCQRVGTVVLGLEVPHAHIHLVPLQSEGDINFAKPKLKLSGDEFREIAAKISKAYHP